MQLQYAIVIEKAPGSSNYSAYVPDLPGCITTGNTIEEIESLCGRLSSFILRGCARTERRSPSLRPRLPWSRLPRDITATMNLKTISARPDGARSPRRARGAAGYS